MRPARFETFLLDLLEKQPQVTGVQTVKEVGYGMHSGEPPHRCTTVHPLTPYVCRSAVSTAAEV
mgnify:CR=1 FL=1